MLFCSFRRQRQLRDAAQKLYGHAMERARVASFFRAGGVPDTVDGRFELLTLHAFLVIDRLADEGFKSRDLSQAFFDVMFRNMDVALRQIGVGDLSVPRHMKRMMRAFKGRCAAYDEALSKCDKFFIIKALKRNLYGTHKDVDPARIELMADYLRAMAAHLEGQDYENIERGEIAFGPLPEAFGLESENDNEKPAGNARMVA
jgi:cytochrome b pre-mRNA-processing protein 3